MERTFLCVLCFSGWIVSLCLPPPKYQYVAQSMTWTEAQTYCREVYTDLATVKNMEEMEQLKSTVPSLHYNSLTWIGVYSKIKWKWSDGYNGSGADYRNWEASKEPDFHRVQFCVDFEDHGKWWDYECSPKIKFICYRGTQQDPEFVYVNEKLDWSNAQRYCREKFIDLATVRNDAENQKIHNLRPSKDWVWIGLYRDPDSYWSDGSDSMFRFWDGGSNPLGSMSVVCGAVDLQLSGKWRPVSCERRLPFVCYNSAVQKQLIKVRMKTEDSSVDLNDPAVRADILKKLQDRLKENRVSGVGLKWREWRDGKVFHKEGESPLKRNREKNELELYLCKSEI